MFDVLMNRYPEGGSNDIPPQPMPPSALGKIRVGSRPSGVNGPRFVYLSNAARQKACASGVTFDTSSLVMASRASGGGLTGNGCVGDETSPDTIDCGTGRSSTPKTGLPVSRSR